MRSTRKSRVALVVPLVLVNTTAVYGQAAWAYDHLVPPALRAALLGAAVVLCLLFAATVESVGIYLAYEAHAALMEDQSSALLRAGSYAVALVVGALNYAHFAGPGWRPNPLAVTFGLLSSLSPWLWAIRSRSLHRAALLAKGLVDPRSVRFTLAQRILYPLRSFGAYRLAVWNGVNSPAQARADYDASRGRTASTDDHTEADTAADRQPDTSPDIATASTPDTTVDTASAPKRTPARRPGRTPKVDTATAARRLRDRHPEWAVADIARRLGVTDRTVRRHLNGSNPSTI